MTGQGHAQSRLTGRAGRQAGLLFSGFAVAQGLSFIRNAVIGHWLSPGDFGIAASITLMLQLIEILTDVGVERLIVQADDGDDPRLIATAQVMVLARGVAIAALLAAAAIPAAAFFHVPDAAPAFAAVAIAPLVKGLLNLDYRRRQRLLDNRAFMIVECLPQAAALLALAPALWVAPSYWAVVWIAIGQAITMVAASHMLAQRPFRVQLDMTHMRRMVAFGWPIWLSAIPLVAVYQGDRAIVGHLIGIEALAGYTAAFMATMVPGLVAAKVGNALMLPLLAAAKHDGGEFARRSVAMCEVTVLAATAYACGFLVAGEVMLPVVFGAHYGGLGAITGWLAVMWALRMVQAVPGMALMALGHTRPFLIAGLIRTTALAAAIWAVDAGHGLAGVAAAGAAGELASALYVIWRLEADAKGAGWSCLLRLLFLAPACAVAMLAAGLLPAAGGGAIAIVTALVVAGLTVGLCLSAGIAAMPLVRSRMRTYVAAQLMAAWGSQRRPA